MASEDTLVLLCVDRNYTSMDAVIKVLGDFFEAKAASDKTDRFNVVFFMDKGPAYIDDFTFRWQDLLQMVVANKDAIEKPGVENGLFLALTFILDIYKLVSGKYFRILVIKDGSVPEITKDFLVNDLIDKVRPMPVFLDFVILGMYEDPDEEKLKNMVSMSQGGDLHHVTTYDELRDTMRAQVEKKEIKVGLWDKKPDHKMEAEHASFFENLSASLEPVEEQAPGMKCTVCFKPASPVCGTDALVRCPSCNTTYHDCCLVSWADASNIGIDHVFRCPICFYLINIPEFLMQEVASGASQSFESFLEEIDQDELLRARDAKKELNLILKELEF